MEDTKSAAAAKGVSRHKLVQNSRDNFYANLNQVYIDNKSAPVLKAAPSSSKQAKPVPAKPQSGTFSRAGAVDKRTGQPLKGTPASQKAPATASTTKPRTSSKVGQR